MPFVSDRSTRQLPPFSQVLEEHGAALLRFCLAQAGSRHGEDVFQETMISALRAYDTVRDPSTVKAWLFSIARAQGDRSEAAARRNVFEGLNRLRDDLAQTALARKPDQPSNEETTP